MAAETARAFSMFCAWISACCCVPDVQVRYPARTATGTDVTRTSVVRMDPSRTRRMPRSQYNAATFAPATRRKGQLMSIWATKPIDQLKAEAADTGHGLKRVL